MAAKLCRSVFVAPKKKFVSGQIISGRCSKGFEIGERVQILDMEWHHIAFAVVIRDLSLDPKFQNIQPYTDPRSSRRLPPYNSAEGFWELQIE